MRFLILIGFLSFVSEALVMASSLARTTESQDVGAAIGICRGRVISVEAFRHPTNGGIFSRAKIQVLETLKGAFESQITVVQRGGMIEGEGEVSGLAAPLVVGDERVWFLAQRADGTLEIQRGAVGALPAAGGLSSVARMRRLRLVSRTAGATPTRALVGEDFESVSGVQQANSGSPTGVTGLLLDNSDVPARFLAPDRGEPIPYWVDATALPAGVSQTQALTTVSQALAAWSAVTGIAFRFDGLTSFGMSAADVDISDEKLRIQLHDTFNEISPSSVLGVGGRAFTNVSSLLTAGGGGQVNGVEFHKTTRGYVVLEHGAPSLQNMATLVEVLCHEIGHALGMAHSSENTAEANGTLKQAIMYFQAHADGRGASLGTYDGTVIQKAHPLTNTPPYSYDRLLPLVSAENAITTVQGINEVQLTAYDLQAPSSSLSLITNGPSAGSASTSSFVGSTLKLTQGGYYGDAFLDPEGNSFWFEKWVRFSDGVHCSPWTRIRVTSIYEDNQPSGNPDGMPNSWMLTHFGAATPSTGTLSRAGDDKDGDGFSNLKEFQMGTSPVDASSRLRVTSFAANQLAWSASPDQLYTVESSTDLQSWTHFGNPVLSSGITATVGGSFIPSSPGNRFFRVVFAP